MMATPRIPELLRPLQEHARRRERWLELLVFVALFAVYAELVAPVVQNGDAAVYNEQVVQHAFGERVIHIGYMLFGSAFHALLPLGIDRAMNLMALTFGLGGAYALYATATHWSSRAAGVSSVLLLLGSTDYVRGMVLSEVDILSASLIMISFALFVRRRSALAGAAFGAAMLCTPISATMLPLFVLAPPPSTSTEQRDGWALVRVQALRVLYFGLVALAVYVPFVAAYYNAYVYGPRGLTTAPHEAFAWLPPIRRGAAFFKENLWVSLPVCLASLVAFLSEKRFWRTEQPALALLVSVLFTGLFADRTSDVPAHLPSIAPLCLLASLFLARLADAWKAAWLVPAFAFLLMAPPAFLTARDQVQQRADLRATYQEMRQQSQPLEFMLVGLSPSFFAQRSFEHYAYGRSYTGLAPSLAQLRRRRAELLSGPTEYVLYFAGRIPNDLRDALADRYVEDNRSVNGSSYRVLVPRSQQH